MYYDTLGVCGCLVNYFVYVSVTCTLSQVECRRWESM